MNFKLASNTNRKISINMDRVNVYTSKWKPGTSFDVEIVRRVPKKVASPEQRGYYYAEVLPKLMVGCGYDADEALMVHRQLKIIFFHVQPDQRGIYRDKNIPSVFSFESDIGIEKRCAFIDWVARKAAEYGEYVNEPK